MVFVYTRLTRLVVVLATVVNLTKGSPLYYRHETVETRSHGAQAFTEGLVFRLDNDLLLESTGLVGKSTVSAYQLKSHETKASFTNPRGEFGEGLAFLQVEDTPKRLLLAQLTYRRKIVHFLDPDTLALVDTKKLPMKFTEGWGLTTGLDGRTLIMSDGSGVLYHLKRDPGKSELVVVKAVTVHDCVNKVVEVKGLNELEKIPRHVTHPEKKRHVRGAVPWMSATQSLSPGEVEDYIWANVIGTWCIAVINPETGAVQAWIDITGLDPSFSRYNRVANGIAYRVSDESVWLTGKNWKNTYRVKLKPGKNLGFTVWTRCKTPWHVQRSAYRTPTCNKSG